jgi:N-acyl homoserine lactone hydrolase
MTWRTLPEIVALEMGTFRFPANDPLAGQQGVAMAYAVRHLGGVLLFDTGFGFGSPELDAHYRTEARRLPDVLAEAGIAIDEIGAVVNCHLHADHAGQNACFPGIPIYVQPVEWETAHSAEYTILDWIDFPDARYERIAGAHAIAEGIRVVPSAGHTRGHQSLLVETPGGLTVIAGQAVYTADEWSGIPTAWEGRTSAWDQDAYDRSIERLRRLAPTRVVFGHDRRQWTA